ncbi:MAG TPA: aromatic ring-hydroxylating dioxygenase subunit alpha [Actinomycetota bacterium]|nr:aromatic ring-hydroxylating dioxygenase subunit alpha [Actinomycetota bacterium]
MSAESGGSGRPRTHGGPSRVDGPALPEDREFGLEKTFPVQAYRSAEAFEAERERIFWRDWYCAAREEEIPIPGDYLALDVAGQLVLLVRGRDGRARAFYDVCRHRGCRLALGQPARPDATETAGPTGRFKGAIRCPYHAWTYGLDGALRAAPFLPEDEEFHMKDLGLHPVEAASWGGFLFVRLTPDEPGDEPRTLQGQVGGLDERVRGYGLADLRIGRRISYEVAANWKVIVENYNECYHCGPVHPELCEVVPAFKEAGGAGLDWDAGIPHREGAYTFTRSGTTDRAPFPGLNDEQRSLHRGELVYPNLMLSLSSDHVAAFTLWARDAGRTAIVCDFLFHPDEMAKPSFDPSDAVDFWDLVNRQDWTICEGVQLGMSARVFRYGYLAPMEDQNMDIRRYVGGRLDPKG